MPTASPAVFEKLIRHKERVETILCLVSEFWKPGQLASTPAVFLKKVKLERV
jgi:hypothetical protein